MTATRSAYLVLALCFFIACGAAKPHPRTADDSAALPAAPADAMAEGGAGDAKPAACTDPSCARDAGADASPRDAFVAAPADVRPRDAIPFVAPPAGMSCLDQLDGNDVPAASRFSQNGVQLVAVLGDAVPIQQPKEAVAIPLDQIGSHGVAVSPHGSRFLAVTRIVGASTKIWEMCGGKAKDYAVLPEGSVAGAVAFSPDGNTLATASSNALLWDVTVAPPGKKATLKGHGTGISNLAFSPDGKTLAVSNFDRTVSVWPLGATPAVERVLATGDSTYLTMVRFAPNSTSLATGGRDKVVKLWDLASEPPRQTASMTGHLDNITTIEFSPDGGLLATSGSESVTRLWDLAANPPQRRALLTQTAKWPTGAVGGVGFSADGKSLLSLSTDGQLVQWDTATGNKLTEWHLPGSLGRAIVSPDGRHVVAVTFNQQVYVFRLPPR